MATIKFKLDKNTIFLHFRQGKDEFKYYTEFKSEPKDWDGDAKKSINGTTVTLKGKNRIKGNSTNALKINSQLNEIENSLRELLLDATIQKQGFSEIKRAFLQKYKPTKIEPAPILQVPEKILLQNLVTKYSVERKNQLAGSTISTFERITKNLTLFCKKNSTAVQDINVQFYNSYLNFLIEEKKYLNGTINGEFNKIKEVLSYYNEDFFPEVKIPYKRFKRLKEPEEQRVKMSNQEAELYHQFEFYDEKVFIAGKKIPVSKTSLEAVRDCYIFSFNTGIPYEPLCKLNETNISEVEILAEKIIYKLNDLVFDSSQQLMNFLIENKQNLPATITNPNISYETKMVKSKIPIIQYHRDKSKKILVTPLNEKCLNIIEKYKGQQRKLLPMMSNQKMNFYTHIGLRQSGMFNDIVTNVNYSGNQTIVTEMKRHEAITFHSARHGFASYLLNSKLPTAFIQKLLGHSSIKTTEIYAKASPQDVLMQAFDILRK